MNPILKSRDYHRSYQKWDKLLIEGKADEIKIIPGNNSNIFFTLSIVKKPAHNNKAILDAAMKFPDHLSPLESIRKNLDTTARI